MVRYTEQANFRLEKHDLIETRFADGHSDSLDSSSTSLHLDEGDPKLCKTDGAIYVYHGNVLQYRLRHISDLRTDDRVYAPYGHITISSSVKQMYEAFSRAINQKLFRLDGDFDCVNQYIRAGMTNDEFDALPLVVADRLYPYYYKSSSLIQGEISYSKKLLPTNAQVQRRITIVNVKSDGALGNYIQNRSVVYLGGNHAMPSISGSIDEQPRRESTRYVEYRYNLVKFRPAGEEFGEIFMAYPFPNTWSYTTSGVNIGFAKLRNGNFLYWATNFPPRPGQQVSKLPLEKVPRAPFGLPEEVSTWPIHDDQARLEDIFEGAWTLRGDRLVQPVNDEDYPIGVLIRLRRGFFRERPTEVFTSIFHIEARVRKAISSLERHGGEMFGFDENPKGVIECDIERLANHLRFPSEVLLAFISQLIPSYKYFQGSISFLLYQKGEGKFRITGPVPVGSWMCGAVTDTGSGLLYVGLTKKYFSIETIDGVSWLTEHKGAGFVEGPTAKLGEWVAFAT